MLYSEETLIAAARQYCDRARPWLLAACACSKKSFSTGLRSSCLIFIIVLSVRGNSPRKEHRLIKAAQERRGLPRAYEPAAVFAQGSPKSRERIHASFATCWRSLNLGEQT